MRVRALDPNTNDWTFGKGQNNYKSNLNAFAQNVQTRVNAWLQDCFFDQGSGVDWRNLLAQKDQQAVLLAISSVIMNTDGFLSLVSLTSTLSSERNLTVNYKILSIYGPVSGTLTTPNIPTGG